VCPLFVDGTCVIVSGLPILSTYIFMPIGCH